MPGIANFTGSMYFVWTEYILVCTQYVLSMYWVCTLFELVCYAQSLYSEIDRVAGLWCHWAASITLYVLSMYSLYWVHTSTYSVYTRYVLSTYFVWTSSKYFVWTSKQSTPSDLLLYKYALEYRYKLDLDKLGERMFGSEANAGVSFQIGQLRYILIHNEYIPVHMLYIPCTCWIWTCFACCRAGDGTVPLAIVVYIDGSFVKRKIPVKMPIYITLWNLTTVVSSLASAWHDAQSQETRYPGTDRHVAQSAGCISSNVYDVNTCQCLWQFGRGNPRLGGLTIEET